MTEADLRTKALELAPAGCAMSAAVLRLFDQMKANERGCDTACRQLENAVECLEADNTRLRKDCEAKDVVLWSFFRRIVAQCEILERLAGRNAEVAALRDVVRRLRERLELQSEAMKKLVERGYGIEATP